MCAREDAFVQHFLQTFNATEAAKRAGIKVKSGASAWNFLQRPRVQELIGREMAERAKKIGITPERVVQLISQIATASLKDYASWDATDLRLKPSEELSREQCRCIKKISTMRSSGGQRVSIELYDATDAIRLLMQYFKLIGSESARGERPEARVIALKIRELVNEPLAEEAKA